MLSSILILITLTAIFLFYASYSIRSGVYVRALCKNPAKGKVVSLTFDDGPDPVQTAKVLDMLKKYEIKACFFCIGHKAKENKELINRMIDEGHLVGNHSFSHTAGFPLHSSRWVTRDLEACEQELPANTYRLFRPPYGVTNPMIGKAVRHLGYTTIGWNIRSLDTCSNHRSVLKRIKRRLTDGSVILLHDHLPGSDRLLEEVIKLLQHEQYSILPLDELLDLNKEYK